MDVVAERERDVCVDVMEDELRSLDDLEEFMDVCGVEQEQIQKRTFTNWINAQLSKRKPPCVVLDLFYDFRDGARLLDLLEVISGQRLSRERGRGMFQHRSNIETALSFLKKKSIKLVNINVPDIIDGKPSIILGLIWTIIMHFHIEELASSLSFSSRQSSLESLASLDTIGSSCSSARSSPLPHRGPAPSPSPLHQRFRISAKKALLLWVRDQCHKAGCTLSVKDFKASWRSGVVFLAVLSSLRPGLLDLTLARTRTNRQNLEEAFRLAERELRIPRLLDPADVDVREPDEKSIMTYVAQFLQYSKDMPVSEEDMAVTCETPPKCLSPINLPSNFTPAISASPYRQGRLLHRPSLKAPCQLSDLSRAISTGTSASQKAQEVTCWLEQAYQELLEGWDSTEGESYAERYHVFQTFIVSFNEQRRPVMPLLTAMKRTSKLSEEQKGLRVAWDSLAEKLREYKAELDLSLPAPLDTVGRWLLRAEAALSDAETDAHDHVRAAEEAREKMEQLKTCMEEMPRYMKTFQTFQNMDEYGGELVPSDKVEEMKRRFTSVRVAAKYHGIRLEYQEQRHTALHLLGQINTKLNTWKKAYISQEAVRVLLQDWHETVGKQELVTQLEGVLAKLKHTVSKYSSKAALAGEANQVGQQMKKLQADSAVAMEAVTAVKSTMGRVMSSFDSFSDLHSSLLAWLEQGTQRAEVCAEVLSEWGCRQARLNQVGSYLLEVTDPHTSRRLAEELRSLNLHWDDYVRRVQLVGGGQMPEQPIGDQVRPQTLQILLREATQLLKEPLDITSAPLRTYRKRLQFMMMKIKEVDLDTLAPSPEFPADTLQKFKQAMPEVLQTLCEAMQVCEELQQSVCGLESRLAELLLWESEARELYQLLRHTHRGQDPRTRELISRGLQLEGQVVMEEQDLQAMVLAGQKSSPLQYLLANAIQERVRHAVSQSQEFVGLLSSLGSRRDHSPPRDPPPPKIFIQSQAEGAASAPPSDQSEQQDSVIQPKDLPQATPQDERQTSDPAPLPSLAQPVPQIVVQEFEEKMRVSQHHPHPEKERAPPVSETPQTQSPGDPQAQASVRPKNRTRPPGQGPPRAPEQLPGAILDQRPPRPLRQPQGTAAPSFPLDEDVLQGYTPPQGPPQQPPLAQQPAAARLDIKARKAQARQNRPWLQQKAESGPQAAPAGPTEPKVHSDVPDRASASQMAPEPPAQATSENQKQRETPQPPTPSLAQQQQHQIQSEQPVQGQTQQAKIQGQTQQSQIQGQTQQAQIQGQQVVFSQTQQAQIQGQTQQVQIQGQTQQAQIQVQTQQAQIQGQTQQAQIQGQQVVFSQTQQAQIQGQTQQTKIQDQQVVFSQTDTQVNIQGHQVVFSKQVVSQTQSQVKIQSQQPVASQTQTQVKSQPQQLVAGQTQTQVKSQPQQQVASQTQTQVKSQPQQPVASQSQTKPQPPHTSQPQAPVAILSQVAVGSRQPPVQGQTRPLESVHGQQQQAMTPKQQPQVQAQGKVPAHPQFKAQGKVPTQPQVQAHPGVPAHPQVLAQRPVQPVAAQTQSVGVAKAQALPSAPPQPKAMVTPHPEAQPKAQSRAQAPAQAPPHATVLASAVTSGPTQVTTPKQPQQVSAQPPQVRPPPQAVAMTHLQPKPSSPIQPRIISMPPARPQAPIQPQPLGSVVPQHAPAPAAPAPRTPHPAPAPAPAQPQQWGPLKPELVSQSYPKPQSQGPPVGPYPPYPQQPGPPTPPQQQWAPLRPGVVSQSYPRPQTPTEAPAQVVTYPPQSPGYPKPQPGPPQQQWGAPVPQTYPQPGVQMQPVHAVPPQPWSPIRPEAMTQGYPRPHGPGYATPPVPLQYHTPPPSPQHPLQYQMPPPSPQQVCPQQPPQYRTPLPSPQQPQQYPRPPPPPQQVQQYHAPSPQQPSPQQPQQWIPAQRPEAFPQSRPQMVQSHQTHYQTQHQQWLQTSTHISAQGQGTSPVQTPTPTPTPTPTQTQQMPTPAQTQQTPRPIQTQAPAVAPTPVQRPTPIPTQAPPSIQAPPPTQAAVSVHMPMPTPAPSSRLQPITVPPSKSTPTTTQAQTFTQPPAQTQTPTPTQTIPQIPTQKPVPVQTPTQAPVKHQGPPAEQPQPRPVQPQAPVLEQPQVQAAPRGKAAGLAQAPTQAYTEAYAKAQALARNHFEEAKHCLQEHILEAITVFRDKQLTQQQALAKEEMLGSLDTEMLEEFLRAAEGMEAFCTPSQLRDMEFFTQSVRTQWEGVCAAMAEYVKQLRFTIKRREFNSVMLLCEMHFNTQRLRPTSVPAGQACFSVEGSVAQAGRQLQGLKDLCDTLSPEDAHLLAQAQLRECEKRLAAIQHQFSAEQDTSPTNSGPSPITNYVPVTNHTSNTSHSPVTNHITITSPSPVTSPTPITNSCPVTNGSPAPSPIGSPAPQQACRVHGDHTYHDLSRVRKSKTVQKREIVKQMSAEDEAAKEATERYRSARFALVAQLNRNEQSMVGDLPSDSITTRDLQKRHKELQALTEESELLWGEFARQCSLLSQLRVQERGPEQEQVELALKWREQKTHLQNRVTSLGSALQLVDSTERSISEISERLDTFIKEPKDITTYTLTNANILKDIKELDESIQAEMDRLSRFDSDPSHLDLRDRAPLTQVVLSHRGALDRLRQQVRKSEAAARALDRFLMSLRTVHQDVSALHSAPSGDAALLQEGRAKLALIRPGVESLAEKGPQLDRLLEGGRLSVTRGGAAVSCLDMASGLLGALEEADAKLASRQQEHQKAQQNQGLTRRRATLAGQLRRILASTEKQGLQEPTIPAVQQRMRALQDIDGQLSALLPEISSLKEAGTPEEQTEHAQSEIDTLWEETNRAVTDRQEQCSALMELLKKFQNCRSYLGNVLQKAEQTIHEQASYMGKDNLQRLITTVHGIKEELSGVGAKIEEMRCVCRQLQSLLKKIPDCTNTPFEGEADTLVDTWLDVTEKTDSYSDNLCVGLELWEKQLVLGGEVESWAANKMAALAQSHPFHSETQVAHMKAEIETQEENIERFHKKTQEIQQLLQGKEEPLELQVLETGLRKRMEQVKELFADASDVFQELQAVRRHLTQKMADCQSSVQKIRSALTMLNTVSNPQLHTQTQELREQLQEQEEQLSSLLKEVGVMASVAGPEVLEALAADTRTLRETIASTHQLLQQKREQGERSLMQTVKDECHAFEEWFQDLQLNVNECFENPETCQDVETALKKLEAFLSSVEGEQRLSQLCERVEGSGEEHLGVEPQALLRDLLQEQQEELDTFRAHCRDRHALLQNILQNINGVQREYDYFRDWLQQREHKKPTGDEITQLHQEFLSHSGRAEAFSSLLSSAQRQGLRGEVLLIDSRVLLERYGNLKARVEQQAQEHAALQGALKELLAQMDSTSAWIRDRRQALDTLHQDAFPEDRLSTAQAVLSLRSEGDAKLRSLRRQVESVCERDGLEEERRRTLQQALGDAEEQWTGVLRAAEEAQSQAELQDSLSRELQELCAQEESTLAWVQQLQQGLDSLDQHTPTAERLSTAQAVLKLRSEGDAKLRSLRGRVESVCERDSLEEERRCALQQALGDAEEQWTGVLRAAEEAQSQAELQDSLSRELQELCAQEESTLAWVQQLNQGLDSLDQHTPTAERLGRAQAVLLLRSEGDAKLQSLRERVESVCEREGLEEERRRVLQQALGDAEEQWTGVLRAAEEAQSQAELQDSLSRELQELRAQEESTLAWVQQLQQGLDSMARGTHGSPEHLEERYNRAQAVLNVKAEGNGKLASLRKRVETVCSREDLEESRRRSHLQSLRDTDNEWRGVLQAAQEQHCVLKRLVERIVSCQSQKQQTQDRLDQLRHQTDQLPRRFPWPGLGERRHTLEQARALLDRIRTLAPSLAGLRAMGRELYQTTHDPSWTDHTWSNMEESVPSLLLELTELIKTLEEGIQTERVCAQLVEQHSAAQDWLREQVKGLPAPPTDRQGLQASVNTLKALLQTVDREKREMRECDAMRDSLLHLCTPGGRDALSLEVKQLHTLCDSSEQEVREQLCVCEARVGELERRRAVRSEGLRAEVEGLLAELRAQDQTLTYCDQLSTISQLQDSWHSLKCCERGLEGLEGKVRDLSVALRTAPSEEELPAELVSSVETVTQTYCSLRSRLSDRQTVCAENTVQIRERLPQDTPALEPDGRDTTGQ
ncbi:hypothetical protein ACEWY4_005111 [Coilia grayii]|uniref:Calponin-homology (CH) domain-containing protein n=1 Tax=Coilia grayii TaxID=363190 RepID=A0ABD1KHZ8_9TELE